MPSVVVAWNDSRSGTSQIRTSVTLDFGLSWTAPNLLTDSLPVPNAYCCPQLTSGPNGEVGLVAQTRPSTGRAFCSYSVNGGLSWTEVDVFDHEATGAFAETAPAILFEPNYENFMVAWRDANPPGGPISNRSCIGGFRLCGITANGWDDVFNPATTALNFELSGFRDSFGAFVFLSVGSDDFALPDGRLWAMGPSPSLFEIIPLSPSGDGSTALLPNPFASFPPIGLTVRFSAFGTDGTGVNCVSDVFTFGL